jgi:hypothetical protein
MNQDKGSSYGQQLLVSSTLERVVRGGDGTSIHKCWMPQQQAGLSQEAPN